MTVSATVPFVAYSGAGTSGPFTIPFRFLADADLVVSKFDADDVETVLTGNTITGAGDDDGGTLFTASPVAIGYRLEIRRDTTRTQTAQYVANGPFPAATHERALDKAMLIAQKLDRAIVELSLSLEGAAEAAGYAGALVALATKANINLSNVLTSDIFDRTYPVQGQPGTASRSSVERFNDRLNVLDFYRTGDTSWSAAILRARDKAAGRYNGGTLFFPMRSTR